MEERICSSNSGAVLAAQPAPLVLSIRQNAMKVLLWRARGVQHIRRFAHFFFIQQVIVVKASTADEDADALRFKLLESIKAFAGGGGEPYAAVDHDDAPEAGHLRERGKEVAHELATEFIAAVSDDIRGEENERAFFPGLGKRRCRACVGNDFFRLGAHFACAVNGPYAVAAGFGLCGVAALLQEAGDVFL